MATIEESVLLRRTDSDGNSRLMYPVTTVDNVDGLEEALSGKLDSITGSAGQIIGFDENGNTVAQDLELNDSVLVGKTDVAIPVEADMVHVRYVNNKFMALAENSKTSAYSTDGVTWTQAQLSVAQYWSSIVYGNGVYVLASSSYSDAIYYSLDGNTLNYSDIYDAEGNTVRDAYFSIAYGDGKFVALGLEKNIVAYSTDGMNWSTTTMPTTAYWDDITYGDGKFVAVSTYSNNAAYSLDGITWTQTTLPASAAWYSVAYGDGKFVAIAPILSSTKEPGTTIAAYSTDGITWTETTMPVETNWYEVTYGDGKFVAVSANLSDQTTGSTAVAYSTDGITWTETTMPAAANWISVTYGGGRFVATALEHSISGVWSYDGITWYNQYIDHFTTVDGTDVTTDVKTVLACTAEDVGADAAGSAAQALVDAKAYTNACVDDLGVEIDNLDDKFSDSVLLNWGPNTVLSQSNWRCVLYANDRFVAGGQGCTAYSTDGVAWTETALDRIIIGVDTTKHPWRSIAYGNGRYVALAYCTAASSNNGIAWTTTRLPAEVTWTSVVYGDNKFVAVGNGVAAYSTDGITWTETTMPVTMYWLSVTYGDGKFVAVGSADGSSKTTTAAYSTDGITWTETTMPVPWHWLSVTYGDGKFVAVGYSNSAEAVTVGAYSTDGITWTKTVMPGVYTQMFGGWYCVTYGDGKFVATGSYYNLAYSVDGVTWTAIDTSKSAFSSSYCYGLAYGNNKFVAVFYNGAIEYSVDGIEWSGVKVTDLTTVDGTTVTEDIKCILKYTADDIDGLETGLLLTGTTATMPNTAYWASITFGDGIFVAIDCVSSNIAAYSTDGIAWTQTVLPAAAQWQTVTYGDGKFVAVAYGSDIAAYSTDGITWNQSTLPSVDLWAYVAYGDGKFVALPYENGNAVAYSTDGITWNQATSSGTIGRTLAYGNGVFVSDVSYTNATYWSTDGITWKQANNATTYSRPYFITIYGNGAFVTTVTGYDYVEYSTDGKNWTRNTLPIAAQWTGAAYGGGKFVIIAYGSNIAAYSTDGITWTQTVLPVTAKWYAVTYGNGKFIALAPDSNVIAVSTDGVNWYTVSDARLITFNGIDITADVKTALKYTAEDVGADTVGSAAQALTDAKAYTDAHLVDTNNPHNVTAEQIGALARECISKYSGDITDVYNNKSARYIVSSDVTGMPIDDEWWFVDVLGNGYTDVTITATLVSTEPKVYVKTCINDNWGDWRQVAMSDHTHDQSDINGTVTIANGGTGATDIATARTNLGMTTESWTFTLENGSTVTKSILVVS